MRVVDSTVASTSAMGSNQTTGVNEVSLLICDVDLPIRH